MLGGIIYISKYYSNSISGYTAEAIGGGFLKFFGQQQDRQHIGEREIMHKEIQENLALRTIRVIRARL